MDKSQKENMARDVIQQAERASEIFPDQPQQIGKIAERPDYGPVGAPEMGWKRIPVSSLPTQGLFYPEGSTIDIKAASVKEIRHFSTLEEDDFFALNDALNLVIERCCKLSFGTFRDVAEADRFYLIFCVRDLTFKNGENRLVQDVQDPQTGETESVEVTRDKFSYYELPTDLMRHYTPDARGFVFRTKSEGNIPMGVPTIGVTRFVFNYVRDRINRNEFYDKVFAKFAPFLIGTWTNLTEKEYKKYEQDCISWSPMKLAIVERMVEKIQVGVKVEMKHTCKSGAEVTEPIRFQGGIKSLFIISNIADELL